MASVTIVYSSSNDITTTALTTTFADNEMWASAAIDNETSNYVDVLVGGYVDTGGSAGTIDFYAFASADAGTTYSGKASGSEGESTTINLTEMRFLGSAIVDATGTYEVGPFSIASAFGAMPDMWGVAIHNQSGGSFTTAANHDLHWMGITYDVT